MVQPNVNLVSVLIASVASMIVGFLWYSPILFGNPWMKLVGMTKESMSAAKKGMAQMYALSAVAGFVMAYVLAHFASYTGAKTITDALSLAFWVWLGFVATVKFTDVLFVKKPLRLYFIDSGYQLASLAVMSVILVTF